ILDRKGNFTIYKGGINWYYPERHDLIFSEIMADPSPPVYLPEKEYLEIFNRSGQELNLKDWKLFTGNKQWILPEIKIPPGSYYFFTSGGDATVFKYSNHTGIFSSNSVISNRQESFLLYTPDNILIDAVPYTISWYNDDYKAEGGWSLEKADMENLCGWKNSWKESEALEGGTPGRENSIKREVRDIDPPFLRHVIRVTDSTFILRFNEPLDDKYFELQKDIALTANSSITSLELLPPFFHECRLGLNRKFIYNSILFKNIWADCEGNVSLTADSLIVKNPAKSGSADVIISEVLFSPWPGCPEFIELYNRSDDILNLSDFKICISKISESPPEGKFLTDEEILFFPGSFLIISRDSEKISYYYDVPDDFHYINWSEFPSLPDKGARISLYDRGNTLIDEMVYEGSDHFPLINDPHGVSLERIILDNHYGTSSEWHSASSIRGFATPGRLNSQNIRPEEKGSDFNCEYKTFTPDNDGYRDVALINIKMEKEGYVAMIRVFDSSGRLKRTIGNNELLGIEETITWDGRDERGMLCSSGIYLIHMEAFHLTGSKKVFKEAVVLSR
ncbi:MAG: lamin tail domain-containing protein, partial [Bacteroidota bacterium]